MRTMRTKETHRQTDSQTDTQTDQENETEVIIEIVAFISNFNPMTLSRFNLNRQSDSNRAYLESNHSSLSSSSSSSSLSSPSSSSSSSSSSSNKLLFVVKDQLYDFNSSKGKNEKKRTKKVEKRDSFNPILICGSDSSMNTDFFSRIAEEKRTGVKYLV